MTIQTETSKAVYIADGTIKEFVVPFYFFDDHIAVFINDEQLTKDKYQLTGSGKYSGGMVILEDTPPSEAKITITRDVPLNQLVTFLEGENFPARNYEYSLDKIIMALQETKTVLERAILLPISGDKTREEYLEQTQMLYQNLAFLQKIPEYLEEILQIYDEIISKVTDEILPDSNNVVTSRGIHNKIAEIAPKKYENIVLSPEQVEEDDTYEQYPYKATITINDATPSHFATVVFHPDIATSGMFAPIATTDYASVIVYLTQIPTSEITIPSITLY